MQQAVTQFPQPKMLQEKHLTSAINPGLRYSVLIIGTMLLCLVIVLNVFMSMPLFIDGVNFIYKYQKSQPQPFIRVIQNLISLISSVYGVGIELGLYYLLARRKLLAIVHIFCFVIATYVIGVLNQGIQQTRPLWYDDRIEYWDWICPKDFGNPSGHCFAAVFLLEPIVSDAIGYKKFHLLGVPLGLICILMPLARQYLGVHSSDQVLLGLTFGFLFLILYKYIYQFQIYDLFWEFLHHKDRYLKIAFTVILHIVIIIIPIIFYLDNSKNQPVNPHQLWRMNKQCGTNKTGDEMQTEMMTSCAIGCVSIGFLYGMLMLKSKAEYRRYLLGLWHYRKFYMWFVHILIAIVCVVLPLAVFVIAADYGVKDRSSVGKHILYCIGGTLAGIGVTFTSVVFNVKCKVMDEPMSKNDNMQPTDDRTRRIN